MEDAEAKWKEYFYSIRTACPWSWAAWQKGSIDIQSWEGRPQELGDWDARLYVARGRKFRIIKKIAKRMNDTRPQDEWLWSHPDFGNNSTPVPVLIQQSRIGLETVRKSLKNNNFV